MPHRNLLVEKKKSVETQLMVMAESCGKSYFLWAKENITFENVAEVELGEVHLRHLSAVLFFLYLVDTGNKDVDHTDIPDKAQVKKIQ